MAGHYNEQTVPVNVGNGRSQMHFTHERMRVRQNGTLPRINIHSSCANFQIVITQSERASEGGREGEREREREREREHPVHVCNNQTSTPIWQVECRHRLLPEIDGNYTARR